MLKKRTEKLMAKLIGADQTRFIASCLHRGGVLPPAVILRPMIVLGKQFDELKAAEQVFVLYHEYAHIRLNHCETLLTVMNWEMLKQAIPEHDREIFCAFALDIWTNEWTKFKLGYGMEGIILARKDHPVLCQVAFMEAWTVHEAIHLYRTKSWNKKIRKLYREAFTEKVDPATLT